MFIHVNVLNSFLLRVFFYIVLERFSKDWPRLSQMNAHVPSRMFYFGEQCYIDELLSV